MRAVGVGLLAGLLLLVSGTPATGAEPKPSAYEVVLKSGGKLRATRVRREGGKVHLRMPQGPMTLPESSVVSIKPIHDTKPASSSSSAGFNVVESSSDPARGSGRSVGGEPRQPRRAPVPFPRSGSFGPFPADAKGPVWPDTVDGLRDHLIEHPGDDLARVLLGEKLAAQRRFREALVPLRQLDEAALPRSWRLTRDIVLAGVLLRLDRNDEAIRVYKHSPLLEEPGGREALQALEQERDGLVGLLRSTTPNFVVRVSPEVSQLDLDPLLDELEVVHAELFRALGAEPRDQVTVILYPGDEFWEQTGHPSVVRGLFDGKVRIPAGQVAALSPRLKAILRHEVAHAFIDALTQGQADRRWHEGIAEHFEGSRLRYEADLADSHRSGRWPPPFSYPAAHSRIEWFLRRWDTRQLGRLLVEAGRRGGMHSALQAVVGLSEAELDEAWGRDLSSGR
ncbi:MAG: hypothetical protein AAF533_21320 [Acidobacteriota bacterium]